jgi:hypothetical protein
MQTDILNGCPDNGEATGLRRKHINLIRPLPHIAEEAFDGIGGLNVSMHALREVVKRQEVPFIFRQASYRFGIPLSVLRFEGGQVEECLRLRRLLPDPSQFSLDITTLSSRNGIEHIALLMRPASVDEEWPKTAPRAQPRGHRVHQ